MGTLAGKSYWVMCAKNVSMMSINTKKSLRTILCLVGGDRPMNKNIIYINKKFVGEYLSCPLP